MRESPRTQNRADQNSPAQTTTSGTRSRQGQTEPLAALVAVTAVCIAVSMYTGVLTSILPETGTERSVAPVTADRLWEAIEKNGVYTPKTEMASAIQTETLPQGTHVAVTVKYIAHSGRAKPLDSVTFGPSGTRETAVPPDSAERFRRPVPVRIRPGDLRPGTLVVVVWS